MKDLKSFFYHHYYFSEKRKNSPKKNSFEDNNHPTTTGQTLILLDGLSMMYLFEPRTLSVHEQSQVTELSCRTSFHLWPGGG